MTLFPSRHMLGCSTWIQANQISEQSQEVDLAVAPSQTVGGHPKQFHEVDVAFVPPEGAAVPRKRRRWWLWLLGLGLIGAAGYGLLPRLGQEWQPEAWMPQISRVAAAAYDLLPRRGQEASKGATPAAPPASRGVPVVAAAAKQGNLDIYLTGLGSVTAFNMVTVRPRVSGHLVKVAFQEGQFVRKGDLLAEIDPRPFQVQLAQAEGQMAHRPSPAQECPARSRTLQSSAQPRPDLQTGI